MGNQLSLGMNPGGPTELHLQREAAELTGQQREIFHSMLNEAHFGSSEPPSIVMPWEMPALSLVFGEEERPLVPPVRPVLGYVEPAPLNAETPAVLLPDTKATACEHAISFESRRTCHLPEGEQFSLLVQKWEALISINYRAFDLGVNIELLEYEERLGIIGEVLGGKAVATVRQRLSQLSRFVQWSTSDAKRPAFPVTAELIKNYVRHLRNNAATHSCFSGFLEALKFSKFVVGLQCDIETFDSAWVAGIMRTASQARPLRKQSKTLTVEALKFLEQCLEDTQLALVDRYAVGVFLFATYSRARFGDLRSISQVFVDEVRSETEESMGYLEMHSASHKMRSTGNRLGAHLPLVAPLKGLGPKAWGKTFVDLSKEVGLSFQPWAQLQPLLPAPNMMGAWTDRPVTSGEVKRWICQILLPCAFETEGFTPHGCKATTLAMLSKYGVPSETRLALGHHQIQKGAVEVYARDTQSAPLRVLEAMFRDIRKGHFHPDQTRSGMFLRPVVQQGHAEQSSGQTDPPLSASFEQVSPSTVGDLTQIEAVDLEVQDQEQPDKLDKVVWPVDSAEGAVEESSSDSSSSSDSDADSCATEVMAEQAATQQPPSSGGDSHKLYQHRRSKTVHSASSLGTTFLCGRQATTEYRPCPAFMVVDSMRCLQCHHKAKSRSIDQNLENMDAVVKRARRQ